MRNLLIAVLLSAASLTSWSQSLVNGVQPTAINGVTVVTGATAIDGVGLTAPGGGLVTANWTLLQSGGQDCTSGTTCTINTGISATTANSVFIVSVYADTNISITSTSFAGCTGGSGTWTGNGAGAPYQAYLSAEGAVMWAYNLGNGGGCSEVDVTLSGAQDSNGFAAISEWSRGGGTPVLDALASTNALTTSCTSCTGSAFSSLSGTEDLLVQVINDGSSTGSPSSPYVWNAEQNTAYALNSTQLTSPTWTQSGGPFVTLGAAFK
jgi:hypothetical protein